MSDMLADSGAACHCMMSAWTWSELVWSQLSAESGRFGSFSSMPVRLTPKPVADERSGLYRGWVASGAGETLLPLEVWIFERPLMGDVR